MRMGVAERVQAGQQPSGRKGAEGADRDKARLRPSIVPVYAELWAVVTARSDVRNSSIPIERELIPRVRA